jgi:tRNA(Arg) A34 adenosine deaminase TadA
MELQNIARRVAAKSEHHQHHHAVIITKGGAIVAMGTNRRFKHAEQDALEQLFPNSLQRALITGKLHEFHGGRYTVYSFRFRKDGSWGMAAPCEDCAMMLGMLGIRKVWYTNGEGQLIRL